MLLRLKNRRGFTLIELLVALGLLSLITSIVFSFLFHGTKAYSIGDEKSTTQQDTSIAAFSITNTIRNVNEISLSDQPGYSQLDIQSRYPNISQVEYTITEEESGIYSLTFTLTHEEGYSIESKVLLNNIKDAVVGVSATDIWFLASDTAADMPGIAIGAGSGTIVEGSGGTITYNVSTVNIENGENLEVNLNASPIGLSVSNSYPSVNNDSAEIIVTGTPGVTAGIYTFSVSYPGASERTVTFFIVPNIPFITLEGDSTMTIAKGISYSEPGYSATDSNGSDISGSVIIDGDTVNVNIIDIYEITYNVTNSAGVPAVEVVRTVTVEDSGPEIPPLNGILDSLTFTVNNPGNAQPTIIISPPANLHEAIISSITGSSGNYNASIEIDGYTATITRGDHRSPGTTQTLTITITITRDGNSVSRIVQVNVPHSTNNGNKRGPDVSIIQN